MTAAGEGVIKFSLAHTHGNPLDMTAFTALCKWRDRLWTHALIGQDAARYEGYGFGNVSQRTDMHVAPAGKRAFVISGTQTGHIAILNDIHYTRVDSYDVTTNSVSSSGPVKPSSESLTHGVIYDLDSRVRVVLHAHTPAIWNAASRLGIPVTDERIEYGTPEMANEGAFVPGICSA